jgi:hypothetical protein
MKTYLRSSNSGILSIDQVGIEDPQNVGEYAREC